MELYTEKDIKDTLNGKPDVTEVLGGYFVRVGNILLSMKSYFIAVSKYTLKDNTDFIKFIGSKTYNRLLFYYRINSDENTIICPEYELLDTILYVFKSCESGNRDIKIQHIITCMLINIWYCFARPYTLVKGIVKSIIKMLQLHK